VRTFAFNYTGSFGSRLPCTPIYAESPHLRCEHSLYFGSTIQIAEKWKNP